MKRAALAALLCALVAAPAALAISPGETPGGNLPAQKGGTSIGEGLPFKAYASMTPTVHLFGDQVTAKLAVVADTKFVDPVRLRVHTSFRPYTPVAAPTIARIVTGRFEQVTWTWHIRCIDSACVPRVPRSDKFHVFHFPPAHVDYLTIKGKPAYGLNAYWPPVEVLSQISPGVQKFLQLTNHIDWRFQLRPVAAPTYRFSPTWVLWISIALGSLFGGGALFFFGRWYLMVRPRRSAVVELPGTPLERALAVLRFAHETGDETLQRKAFERVAGELGLEQADELTRMARELAWSPRTPEDEEVEAFAAQALEVRE
jgi:hypothetical protein